MSTVGLLPCCCILTFTTHNDYSLSLFGSPDDWECFLHYLGCLLEDDSNWCAEQSVDPIHPPKKVLCKISPLGDELVRMYSLKFSAYCIDVALRVGSSTFFLIRFTKFGDAV